MWLRAAVSVRCARERGVSSEYLSGPKSAWSAWASDLVRGREKLEKGPSKSFRGHHVVESARCRPWFLALRAIHIHLVTEATGDWTDGIYIRQWWGKEKEERRGEILRGLRETVNRLCSLGRCRLVRHVVWDWLGFLRIFASGSKRAHEWNEVFRFLRKIHKAFLFLYPTKY